MRNGAVFLRISLRIDDALNTTQPGRDSRHTPKRRLRFATLTNLAQIARTANKQIVRMFTALEQIPVLSAFRQVQQPPKPRQHNRLEWTELRSVNVAGLNQLERDISGFGQYISVFDQTSEPKRQLAALTDAKHIAGASQSKIDFGDLESIGVLFHRRQSSVGFRRIGIGKQEAIALEPTAPNPSSQLVKL